MFAALGDRTRLGLVTRLSSGGPASIADLTEGTQVTRQAVTKHLQVLAEAGLTRSHRRGRERVWQLQPARLEAARRWLDDLSAQWDSSLSRLQAMVERPE